MAVHNAVNSTEILRMKKIWGGLSSKYRAMNDQQHRLLELSRNFQAYRQKLKQVYPPIVPYLGLTMSDLTFSLDGTAAMRASPTDPDKKLINFDRYMRMARVVSEVQRCQMPYRFREVSEIQNYLDAVLVPPSPSLRGTSAKTRPTDEGQSAPTITGGAPPSSKAAATDPSSQSQPLSAVATTTASSLAGRETPLPPTSPTESSSTSTPHPAPASLAMPYPSPPAQHAPLPAQKSVGVSPAASAGQAAAAASALSSGPPPNPVPLSPTSLTTNLNWASRPHFFSTRRKESKNFS